MNGECPMCGAKVRLKSTAAVGDLIYCNECDVELEIVSLSPVELDWPLEEYVEDYSANYQYDYDDGDD